MAYQNGDEIYYTPNNGSSISATATAVDSGDTYEWTGAVSETYITSGNWTTTAPATNKIQNCYY